MKRIVKITVVGLLATGLMVCAADGPTKEGNKAFPEFETPAMPANPPDDWLTYHLLHPGPGGAMPGDPNCAFYWKGLYHLHYIYNHRKRFTSAHISSKDLVHWTWHPTTLFPKTTGHGMFSGAGFITKEGQPAVSARKNAPENLAVRLFRKGGDITVKQVKGWKMKSIYVGN